MIQGNTNNHPDDGANKARVDAAPMTTSEMLELAAVDALGLLDDAERASFDRAFADAPSSVRELLRSEQARVAELGLELPDIDPDPALRRRVLDRIRAEIDRSQAVPAVADRPARHHAVVREPSPAPRSLGLRRARRVNSIWRVATVGASVAAVVLAVLQVQLRQNFDELQRRSEIASLIDSIGIEHVEDALFADANVQRVQFTPVGQVGRAQAMMLRNPDRDTSRLYVMNLASRTTYSVVAVDADNKPLRDIASFETDDLLTGVDLEIAGAAGETVRLAIMTSDDEPVMLFVAEILLT